MDPIYFHHFITALKSIKQKIMRHFKLISIIQFIILFWIKTTSFGQAFTCNADLTYSMKGGTVIQMYPSDFLEQANVDDKLYKLEIKDQNNNTITDNKISYSTQSKIYTARVTHLSSGNGCWTDFTVIPAINTHPSAVCKANLVASLAPSAVNLSPFIVDNGSSNFVSLFLNKNLFNCNDLGINKVKLSAVGTDNIISQCECTVDIQDKLAPVVVMKSDRTISLNAIKPYKLTPDSVGSYFDNCDIVSVEVIPNQIDCNSPNPTTVKLIVKDKSGAVVSGTTKISYTSKVNPFIACNDQINIEVNPTSKIEVTPQMVLEGTYGCNQNFKVTLSLNGVIFVKPEITYNEKGKTILYAVEEISNGNKCWGNIIVKEGPDCTMPYRVCDKSCPNGTPGDCNSDYTDTDNLDWPCNVDIELCDAINISKVSPDDLINFHNIAPENSWPQVINYNCKVIFMTYTDQEIGTGGLGSPNKKILRTWSVLNWLTSDLSSYVQVINVIVVTPSICDTKPWNTPVGDCSSGHTLSDAVEWPADITISQSGVSLVSLRNNPDVHPNDVEPALVVTCNNGIQKTYSDLVITIDATSQKIERTWSIIAWNAPSNIYTYKQNIIVTGLGQASVCVNTYNGKPVKDVELGFNFGKTGDSGCASFAYIPNSVINPSKKGSPKEGLDIMDLIATYEYVLGVRTLNPYQIMAADITTGWNQVSTLDYVYLKKMIDGEISEWPNNIPDWRFLDADHQIVNGMPSPAKNFIFTDNLINSNKFIGIKTGDVDGSFNEAPELNKPKFAVLKAVDETLIAGESYSISFTSDRTQNIAAIKLEFEIKDAGIMISDVTSTALPSFSMSKNVVIEGSKVSISWYIDLLNTPNGVHLRTNQDILTFHFTSNRNSVASSLIGLTVDYFQQIKPINGAESINVGLYWENQIINGVADGALSTLVVSPNPFDETLSILGVENEAKYQISSINGQNIYTGTLDNGGQINTASLENGFYILTIMEQGKKPSIHKIVKVE
jgi:Secretion system C-terminal sorting domain